jgi:amino acid transporter
MDGGEPMILGSTYGALSTFISLGIMGIFFLFLATIGIGAVSAVVHDRKSPESLRDWALWLSRGITYVTLAGTGMLAVVYGLTIYPASTIIVLAIFFLGLVAWRMRGRIIG